MKHTKIGDIPPASEAYSKEEVCPHTTIASQCREYCSVAQTQNFGISFLNNLETIYCPDCRFCVNWDDGQCNIYKRHTNP